MMVDARAIGDFEEVLFALVLLELLLFFNDTFLLPVDGDLDKVDLVRDWLDWKEDDLLLLRELVGDFCFRLVLLFDLLRDFDLDLEADLDFVLFLGFFKIFFIFIDELLKTGLSFLMESLTLSNKISSNLRLFLSFSAA